MGELNEQGNVLEGLKEKGMHFLFANLESSSQYQMSLPFEIRRTKPSSDNKFKQRYSNKKTLSYLMSS